MGLLSALSNAVTGLSVNQQNLNVLSQNISNANTPNYSNEVLNQQATFVGGTGAGVSVESITRTVDQYLTAEVQSQTTTNTGASNTQSYYSQIENLLGTPGTSDSIDQNIDSFFSAVQNLANSPSVSNETTVINSAVSLANQVSGLASSLQNLQLQADSQINDSVNSANADLQTLYTTNAALERAAATNQSTSGLLDQRDAALTDLAQYVDIKTSTETDGEVSVNTTNGVTLVTPTSVSELSYAPIASADTLTNNGQISPILVTTLDSSGNPIGKPVTLATGGTASTVTTSLTGGKIQSLLNMRDSVIPNILTQLDQMAASLRDSVNTISNEGSSSPPPESYTGQRLVNASATSQYSGSIQIALLNSSGNPAPSPYTDETNGVQPLTLDLSSLEGSGGAGVLSTNDIINAINQQYGTPQNKTEIGNLNNVQLSLTSDSVPDTNNTLGVNFNLNNISGSSANFYVSGVTVLDNNGQPISPAPTAASASQPATSISGYQANGDGTVTVGVNGTNTYTTGEVIYLNTASTSVGSGTITSGYYTVGSVTGNSFNISAAAGSGTGTASVTASATAPSSTTVASGTTVSAGANGAFTISGLPSSSTIPYYTVEATIATTDASGALVTSTVSYRVPNNTQNTQNDVIGASNATDSGTIVAPTTNQPLVTASLVDANGNPLTETNGSYGNQQGYLKITSDNASYTVAINELDSKQLGMPNTNPPQAGTGQGFSQYYGLNNFFNSNNLTSTGDTVANSALNLSVNSNIVNDPGLIPTGTLSLGVQSTATGALPNYTYVVAPGDNSISQALAGLSTANQSFTAAGGMPPSSTTLSGYAGQIIAKTSNDSTDATNTATDSQTLLTGFTTRAQAVSGVNLDQELANTVIYQNAYTASTRVITVVSNMFDQLLGIIQ